MNQLSGSPAADTPIAATSLQRQLRRVLREHKLARQHLAPTPVHDFRVALRRCRSLTEGFASFDPAPAWRHLRKACKRELKGLAALRDAQVMSVWVKRLRLLADPQGALLRDNLEHNERAGLRKARRSLEKFDRKQWKAWKREMPRRAAGMPLSEPHFAALALRTLSEIRPLDARCRRTGSAASCHQTRVQLKRFRYSLESFLPEQERVWKRDLKRLQSSLGDVHDLDVLRSMVVTLGRAESVAEPTREEWLRRIAKARNEQLERYKRAVLPGSGSRPAKPFMKRRSLFDRWSDGLEVVIGVSLPDGGAASASQATTGKRATAKGKRPRDRRRRPS